MATINKVISWWGACLGMTLVAAGCNPAIYVSGEQTVNARLRRWSLEELTRAFNRQTQVASDIQVSATLWDLSYIVAFQEARATRKELGQKEAEANIEAWRRRFIVAQTAFRVRVDLLNRGEVLEGKDRILDLKQWSWKLKLSDGRVVPYSKIYVELVKRYKSKEGAGVSYRLDGVVHFPRRVDPSKDRYMELWAYPPGDRPVARMRWNLEQP